MIDASVIVPVYNQRDSLKITLSCFGKQTYDINKFEVIVVDDGSTDGLQEEVEEIKKRVKYSLKYAFQQNAGRAKARNQGVLEAEGERIIFCDADRFPEEKYVEKHLKVRHKNLAAIGCPWDFFGNTKLLNGENIDYNLVHKFSRLPQYYKKISYLFNDEGISHSPIVWATFLVGNASLNREDFWKAGGFDENIVNWGFEHFDLAYRLYLQGVEFIEIEGCNNFHIPHPRDMGFYEKWINDSTEYLVKKYNSSKFELLGRYLMGKVSLQEFDMKFGGLQQVSFVLDKDIMYVL